MSDRVTFVLNGSGAFDSRTQRLAADFHGRGHEVDVLGRVDAAATADDLVPGVPRRLVDAAPAAGLPRLLGPARGPLGARLARAEARARGRSGRRSGGRGGGLSGVADEGLRLAAVVARMRAQRSESVAGQGSAGADVYHAMGFLALPVAASLAARAGARLVYDARDLYVDSNNVARLPGPLRGAFAAYERRLARRADLVLTVNDSLADLLAQRWDVVRPTVVRNCAPAWTPPDPPPDLLRQALALPPGTPLLLYHGGFLADRGLPELIAVLARPELAAAHLVLLGEGPLAPRLRELAAGPGVAGRVHLLPAVPPDELLPWVASADVGVMPNQPRTLNERLSTPNKLFESLAAGLPVVSSDFPERRRIILDDPAGPLGAVCDPTDPAALAAALAGLLALPPAERAALRARVLAAAHARYTWDHQAGILVAAYAALPSVAA